MVCCFIILRKEKWKSFIQFVDLLKYAIHVPYSSSSTQYKVFDFIYFFRAPIWDKIQKEKYKITLLKEVLCIQMGQEYLTLKLGCSSRQRKQCLINLHFCKLIETKKANLHYKSIFTQFCYIIHSFKTVADVRYWKLVFTECELW